MGAHAIAKDLSVELIENKFTIRLERMGSKCTELKCRLRFVLSDAHPEMDGRAGTSMLESMLFSVEDILCNIDDRLSDGLLQTKRDEHEKSLVDDNAYLIQIERIMYLATSLQKRLTFILKPSSPTNLVTATSSSDSILTDKLILTEDIIDDILARLDDDVNSIPSSRG